jgi:hypothetical protein
VCGKLCGCAAARPYYYYFLGPAVEMVAMSGDVINILASESKVYVTLSLDIDHGATHGSRFGVLFPCIDKKDIGEDVSNEGGGLFILLQLWRKDESNRKILMNGDFESLA